MSALPPGEDGTPQREEDAAEAKPAKEGLRKDGKPFKDGNTRADGSYNHGKYRTPEHTRFAKNDGRKRGRREPGKKNLLTEWREELDSRITITEGGKTKKISKRRGLIKSQIDRGMKKSDRAAEVALRYAELSEKREPGLQADDLAIIAAWLDGLQRDGDSDDAGPAADEPKPGNDTDTRDGEAGDAQGT